MSENTNNQRPDRIFTEGLILKERTFDDGGSVLNVSIVVDKFAAFVKAHKKSDGYLNLVIAKNKNQTGKQTHHAYVDPWTPRTNTEAPPQPVAAKKTVAKPAPKAAAPVEAPDEGVF